LIRLTVLSEPKGGRFDTTTGLFTPDPDNCQLTPKSNPMTPTPTQLQNWNHFELIRKTGAFRMNGPEALAFSKLSPQEWREVLSNYTWIKRYVNLTGVKV